MNTRQKFSLFLTFVLSSFFAFTSAQQEANYDESNVPVFVLPEILINPKDGKIISDVETWENELRPNLLELFASEMYGVFPDDGLEVNYFMDRMASVFEGAGTRSDISMQVTNNDLENPKARQLNLLLYLPSGKGPKPVFLGLNFYGNHTVHSDEDIPVHRHWTRNNDDLGITNNKASVKSRGVRASRWPVEYILSQGYGIATLYYGDGDPDFDDGFENGLHGLLSPNVNKEELSSISAWAWMLSKAMDYFEHDVRVDETKVAVVGHSRLGKTSLWAGARDERFAIVISNDSGCGGAALSRRAFGETVNRINHSFPHWFCNAFDKYNNNEGALPFDQHSLLALVAPRPLYVASAEDDQWADPKGEFLSTKYAGDVYTVYGVESLIDEEMPDVDKPLIKGSVGYHIRSGKHDITQFDWAQYIRFADMHFK